MGSRGGFVKDFTVPIAVALVAVAVAAYKASSTNLKPSSEDRPKVLGDEPPAFSDSAAANETTNGGNSIPKGCNSESSRNANGTSKVQANGYGHTRNSSPRSRSQHCDAVNSTSTSAQGASAANGGGHNDHRVEHQDGRRRRGSGGSAAAGAAASGGTVVSVTKMRRMCYFPSVILRSGLVFQRVTALSLSGQGIGDRDIPASLAGLAGMLRKVDLSRNRLTSVPPGLLDLGSALEELNLGNNRIADLPPQIANLTGLLFLNLAGNRLTKVTPEIGKLTELRRLGLKGNALVFLPPSIGDLSHLVELYLTGNMLEALPPEIVKLRRLKKLQMSFNNLRSLPSGMGGMRNLELCRLAVNPGLEVVAEGLVFAERLSWVSLGGTAWCARATERWRRFSCPIIPREEVVLGEKLGGGASGEVFAAVYRGNDVAVKVFKSDVSPDGNARDELDVACAVDHPNLTKAIGIVRASTNGGGGNGGATRAATNNRSSKLWLVMERVEGKPLAEKPDFTSVLRCRWGPGRRFEPVLVLAVLLQVARAMSYLHEKNICHGDLYAHNVLVNEATGATVLCDFGASFFYQSQSERHDRKGFGLEGTEVRAFGIMARDMACRSVGCEWILQDLVPSCFQADTSHRPSFHEIINQLHAELMQSLEPSSPMVTSAKSIHSLLDRPDIVAERGRMRSAERREEAFSQFYGGPTKETAPALVVFGCEGPESAKAQLGDGAGVNTLGMRDATAYWRGEAFVDRGAGRGLAGHGRKSGSRGGRISRLGGVQEGSANAEGGGEEDAVKTEVNGTKETGEHL